MRVLVCGGRDYKDEAAMKQVLENILPPYFELICGMARGADLAAYNFALKRQAIIYCFPANWSAHGRAAGPIRNQQMIDDGKPDLVVAFPGGRGTDNMVKLAKKSGIKVLRIA